MKAATVLKVLAAGAAAWALYRVFAAKRSGSPVIPALLHPTVDPRIAGLVGHPELWQTRHGASHF